MKKELEVVQFLSSFHTRVVLPKKKIGREKAAALKRGFESRFPGSGSGGVRIAAAVFWIFPLFFFRSFAFLPSPFYPALGKLYVGVLEWKS